MRTHARVINYKTGRRLAQLTAKKGPDLAGLGGPNFRFKSVRGGGRTGGRAGAKSGTFCSGGVRAGPTGTKFCSGRVRRNKILSRWSPGGQIA